MKKYILIEVGCIECGVSTRLSGVFNTKKGAERKAKKCETWRDGGQSSPHVFEITIKK